MSQVPNAHHNQKDLCTIIQKFLTISNKFCNHSLYQQARGLLWGAVSLNVAATLGDIWRHWPNPGKIGKILGDIWRYWATLGVIGRH